MLLNLIQDTESISGSVVPLAMFFKLNPQIHCLVIHLSNILNIFPSRAFKREGQSQCWGRVAKPCLNFTIQFHTGGKPAQGWPNNQKRAFSPLQCGETLYNSLVAGKMRQTTCYCCLAVVAFFAFFVFCSVPFGVSFITVFHGVFWVVRITLCNAWLEELLGFVRFTALS